jgi:hypothetical protein
VGGFSCAEEFATKLAMLRPSLEVLEVVNQDEDPQEGVILTLRREGPLKKPKVVESKIFSYLD